MVDSVARIRLRDAGGNALATVAPPAVLSGVAQVDLRDGNGHLLATLALPPLEPLSVGHIQLRDEGGTLLATAAIPPAPGAVAEVRLLDSSKNVLATVAVPPPAPAGVAEVQLLDGGGVVLATVAVPPPPLPTITTVQLVGAAGNVVAAAAVTPASEEKLPATLDWYRDASKWLVATAGAAIVFGYGFATGSGARTPDRIAFIVSGVFLLASVLGGILCHFWILSYANAHERLGTASPAVAVRMKKQRDEARNGIRWSYGLMMWPFFIGMAFLVGFCGYRVIWPPAKDAPAPALLAGSGPDVVAVLHDPEQKRVLLLKKVGNELRWEQVPAYPPKPAKGAGKK